MNFNNITLADCREEDIGENTRWTHEASGAYVELIHDEYPVHPLEYAEGMAISFREGDHYCGTMDDHPRDPAIDCPACEGSGESGRFDLRSPFGPIIASGTATAMDAAADLLGYSVWDISARPCLRCKGEGEIDCDLETWFKVNHDATGIYEFRTGDYDEASAVMVATDSDWTDPEGAAKAYAREYEKWAREYEKWAEGDVWGIETGNPAIESETCWGFIGREYAEEMAQNEYLRYAVEYAIKERNEAAYWAARDVETC